MFWSYVADGMSSEAAAVKAEVSQPVGTRWFREAGGMPTAMFRRSAKPLSGRYLSLTEREEIALLLVQGHGVCSIARRLGRAASTISREISRNAATRSGNFEYHATEAMRSAITRTIVTLPEELRRSITWDQGAEMAQHARLKVDAGLEVYFCDPQSPWQRGTNENTNGLLRQYFPKGTDLGEHDADTLAAVAATLNGRPRKTLGWKTPAEGLDQCLAQIENQRVATTG